MIGANVWWRAGAVVLAALGFVAGCDDDGATAPARTMDPTTIPQFAQPLAIPGVMPPIDAARPTEYRIAVRQFRQQILPPPMPSTVVWGYGRDGDPLPGSGEPSTFSSPGLTIEARANTPVRVTWVNRLVDDEGRFLRHLLPVDTTIHWADPGGTSGHAHDDADGPALDDTRYLGPVPMVTHVHGAHSFDHSDGHPEAWYLPDAVDLPPSFARVGPTYRTQAEAGPGAAVFDYPLDEDAATLWYHDHSFGMTRSNVYAGMAGFWLIRDEVEDQLDLPGPPPRLGDPDGTQYFEIPLVIQDRSFTPDGALFYPSSRAQYDGYAGPFIPASDVPPIWGPEFIGDVMVVNGRAWPFLEVEPRLYRFRLLNASDARTLILQLDRAGVDVIQIGADGGRLAAPVRHSQLLLAPAERVDLLVDFTGLSPGETITLQNVGPDDPWGGPDAGQDPADPATTGQVMQFRVVPATASGQPGAVPTQLPTILPLTTTLAPRDLMLAELAVTQDDTDYPIHVRLGTVALGPLPWAAPATEVVTLGSTEIWRVANTTEDAHPIHLHLVDFQILDQTPFDKEAFSAAQAAWLAGTGPAPELDRFVTGPATPPLPSQQGPKDTSVMLPGTITRLIAHFDRAGSYVWHCHIIEHEDNDMMRPLVIVP